MANSIARQRRFWLCREGLYYTAVFLAVLIGAVSRQLNLLMLLGSMLAAPLLFSLLHGRFALRKLNVERKLPAQLHAGGRLRVDLQLRNLRSWFSLWAIRVEDTITRDTSDLPEKTTASVFFPRVGKSETRQAEYEGQVPRRGRYRFGPLRVTTRFPLGLVRHALLVDDSAELIVHPKLGRLGREWSRMIRDSEAGGQRTQARGLLEADFHGLREWRPGDSRRWIHWRTSARQGSLIVKQFEQRRSENVAILVDLWAPKLFDALAQERVETAISFVATLIAESSRKPGSQITLQVSAKESLRRTGPASPVFFREQMDVLALVEPHHQPGLPKELGQALALITVSTPVIVVSTRPVEWKALAQAAAERETELAGRKLTFVNVADPDLMRYFHVH